MKLDNNCEYIFAINCSDYQINAVNWPSASELGE